MDKMTTEIKIGEQTIEVPISTLKVIETLKIGDQVMVLKKDYSTWQTYPGVIIGVEPFKNRPSVLICYLKNEYSAELSFLAYNKDVADVEICKAHTQMARFNKDDVVARFEREMMKKLEEHADLKRKLNFFLENFQRYWGGEDGQQ